MSKYELELILSIRDSKDPTNAIAIALDVIRRMLTDESEVNYMENVRIKEE